jgi:hypothetical protein
MKKARLHRPLRLTASFVVTVSAATAAATATPACKKTTIESPPDESRVTLSRRENGVCQIYRSMSCPKGATCNPPPPQEVDCPPDMRDAGDPPAVTRRPAGKEGWLRVPSRLWVGNDGCTFNYEQFCAPPGKPNAGECTPYQEALKVKCEVPDKDAGRQAQPTTTPRKVDAFVYKDSVGGCHKVPELECTSNTLCKHPDGDSVPCP